MTIPRLVIGGTHSGVGKTTVAVGLMAAIRRRGLRVCPYKVGPDYIDPRYHRLACGRPSASLDSWMMGRSRVARSFARTFDGDIAVIEGMMGLHDGASATSATGSTAEISRLLKAPVVLVIDAGALARSSGALVLGYRQFDRRVNVGGVVANRTAGPGHADFLRPSIEKEASTPFLGYLPTRKGAAIPERHLGLVMPNETEGMAIVDALADLIEEHLDIDALLAIARSAPPLSEPGAMPTALGRHADSAQLSSIESLRALRPSPSSRERSLAHTPSGKESDVRIAVAMDEAFCFYYPDNLALLEQYGAELVPFSPIRDGALPADVDGVYIGGGYPELHAAQLAANRCLRAQIRRFADAGKPVYAECGGFMYLCDTLIDIAGASHAMVGLVPGRTVMTPKLQAIGYREARLTGASKLFGSAGATLRGHEFRYSRYEGAEPANAYTVDGKPVGYARGGVVASYIHLHFGSRPASAAAVVRSCRHARER